MGSRRRRRIPWHVIRASLPLLLANPLRAPRDPFPMKTAMAFRQVQLLRARSPVARHARDAEPRPLYPQLDTSRFRSGFGLDPTAPGRGGDGQGSGQGEEQARSLNSVLGLPKRRQAAVFGVGLGIAAQDVTISVTRGPGKPVIVEEREMPDEEDIGEEREETLAEEEQSAGQLGPTKRQVSPPSSPLPFNISSESFHAARAAPLGSPQSFWRYSMYRGPKADGDKSDTAGRVKVHYCGTRAEMELVCRRHFLGEPVIGLDMEWMIFSKGTSSARENVSLIQIASPSRVALFHIARFPGADGDGDGDGDLAAPTFRRIMADAGVSKTGVNILADCTRLKKHLGVDAAGIVELSHLYRIVKFVPLRRPDMINRKLVALAAQVEDQLGLPLFKGDAVRTGDWMKPLSKSQVRYAASDVYASIQLYHVMESKRQALDPRPAPPFPAELGLPVPVPQFAPTGAPSPSAISGDDVETVEDIVTKDLETLSLSHVAAPAPPKPKFSSKAAKPKSKATRRSSSAAADPRVLAADLKLEQYRSSRASVTTRPSSLRAYYLWADEDALTPESIASLLRDPPLQTSTVAKYILDAMSSEKLPFDAARARRELLPHIHPHLLKTISSLKTFPWDDPPSS